MTKTAAMLPQEEPVAIYMRHCERYTNPPDGDYSKLLLNPNGIQMAHDLGKSIDRKIRVYAASPVERCQQTIREILKTLPSSCAPEAGSKIKLVEEFANMAGDPRPKEVGGVGWYEYFHYLQKRDVKACRGVTLEMEAKPIIDAIFRETLDSKEAKNFSLNGQEEENGEGQAPLDLICSHDGHVVILASLLFDFKTPPYWSQEWCQYAEGIFFYGSRRNFTAIWRNQIKTFTDYLL